MGRLDVSRPEIPCLLDELVMDALTFLAHPLLRVPRDRADKDFESCMKELFDEYKSLLNNVNASDLLSAEIVARRNESMVLCDRILTVLRHYLDGYPERAFTELDEALNAFGPVLASVIPTDSADFRLQALYRLRISTEPAERFTRGDLFHIPFEKRHQVSTRRFSIPGLPCLYLGGSIYVCWEELARPDFNTVHMARFRAATGANLRVLNLSLRPQYWALLAASKPGALAEPTNLGYVAALATLWPLMAACHIKVFHRNGPFKPEYIIPQVLLQWVRARHDLDGVCYTSTHIESTFRSPMGQANFVFPAKERQAKGYCPRLLAQFEVCEPLSWQLAEAIGDLPGSNPIPPDTDFELEPVNGVRSRYLSTTFYAMQYRLCGLPCSLI